MDITKDSQPSSSMKDLSIIIPCYNRIALLKETLKSVEKAISNVNAEIILVDDGSLQPIVEQLNDFSRLPIIHLRQRNSGLTTSRHNGLLISQGKYIQFLDSDDLIDPLKFEKQILAMEKEGADVSHTDYVNIHSSENISDIVNVQHSNNPAEFFIRIQPCPHSPIYRRDYLLKILNNPSIPLTRDFDYIGEVWMYYNLAPFKAKIIKINEPLAYYTHHSNDRLSTHWEQMGLSALKLMQLFIKHSPKNQLYSEESAMYVGQAAFKTFRGLPYNIYKPFQYAFLKVWQRLGSTKNLDGGYKFNLLSKFIGCRNCAIIFKFLAANDYRKIQKIDPSELVEKTNKILSTQI